MLIVTIIMSMILVDNYVLSQFLGICPFLGVSKKLDSAIGMGVAVVFVMVLATIATWPIMQVLNHFEISYLQTVYPVPSQGAGYLSSADHDQLRRSRCLHFQHRCRL